MNITDRKYKAFITDFDGTLVSVDFIPSPIVKNKVLDLISKGFVFQ